MYVVCAVQLETTGPPPEPAIPGAAGLGDSGWPRARASSGWPELGQKLAKSLPTVSKI